MVRRTKEEPAAGVLEFAGRTQEDPEFQEWLIVHRQRNGGKIRIGKGASGVRVVFDKAADMAFWQERAAKPAKASSKV